MNSLSDKLEECVTSERDEMATGLVCCCMRAPFLEKEGKIVSTDCLWWPVQVLCLFEKPLSC